MNTNNVTYLNPGTVILIGIPGLEHVQFWIGFPFFTVCLVALLGNIILLIIIPAERSLHQPMYIFLAVLAGTDIGLCDSDSMKHSKNKTGSDLCIVIWKLYHENQESRWLK